MISTMKNINYKPARILLCMVLFCWCNSYVSLASVTITADYCSLGSGNVKLSVPAGYTYLWSNGATTSSITVHQAGTYSVTATDASGNQSTASVAVGTELITNGDFSAGNTGFTTDYTYNATSLIQEGVYTITSDASLQHPYFHGTDHTKPGTGLFMAINGNTQKGITAWKQVITVNPNTTYYFSAWAMGISSYADPTDRQAILQFSINGAPLGSSFQVTPYTWKQFYIAWNSGANTTATIMLIDQQTAVGGNDFGIDDISFTTLPPVSLSVAATVNSPVCAGTSIALTSTITGGAAPLTFSWQGADGFSSTAQNPSLTNVTTDNNGTYTLTVTDAYHCQSSASTTLNVMAPPQGSLTNDGPVCPKATAHLKYTATSGTGPYTLKINGQSYSGIKSGGQIAVTPGKTQAYILSSITDEGQTNGCANATPDTTIIVVQNDSSWPMALTGDTIFCAGSSSTITASGASSYTWNTGSTNASISINQPGEYSVTGTNDKGCVKSDSVNIREAGLPTADITLSTKEVTDKSNHISYSTTSSSTNIYLWNFGDGSTSTLPFGTHQYDLTGKHYFFEVTLTVTNAQNCSSTSTTTVSVIPFVPNVFTPNGDNCNDLFMPYYTLQVFDRNGILIYQGNDDSPGWDGTYKGKKVDSDTYFYILAYNINANKKKQLKGFVTLVR